MVCLERKKTVCEEFRNGNSTRTYQTCLSAHTEHIPAREDPGLVGLSDDEDDSCLKNSLGFMDRCDTNAAASYRPIDAGSQSQQLLRLSINHEF